MRSQLTGQYKSGTVPDDQHGKIMYWDKFRGNLYSLKEARMMVRPRNRNSRALILQG